MLIHFTSDYGKISSILKSQHLLLKYCKETFSNARGIIASSAAHPMVSFSNYNEDELINTPITYGHFGIQFKWEWAKTLVFKITDIDTIYIKREYLTQFAHDFPQLIDKVKESNWTSVEN